MTNEEKNSIKDQIKDLRNEIDDKKRFKKSLKKEYSAQRHGDLDEEIYYLETKIRTLKSKLNESYEKYTFRNLLEEVLEEVINEEVLTEAKISELLQKDAKLLTKSELNQLAKFKYNLSLRGRENRPRPKSTDTTDRGNSFYKRYDEHEKKYRDLEQKIDQKLRAAGHRGGVSISSSSGYYR